MKNELGAPLRSLQSSCGSSSGFWLWDLLWDSVGYSVEDSRLWLLEDSLEDDLYNPLCESLRNKTQEAVDER